MKKIFFYFIILIIIGNNVVAQGRAPAGEAWKLTESEKKGMLSRLKECSQLKPCYNNSVVVDYDNAEYRWIVDNYGQSAEISFVEARYRQEDVERYRKMRGIEDYRKYNVKGYKTILVKVVLPTGSMFAVTNYYDIFTISPPPND